VWFTFVPTSNGTVSISTCGSEFDTAVQVYSNGCAGLTEIACNDDSCGSQSSLNFVGTGGTTYHIFAAGVRNEFGLLRIRAIYNPSNDRCADAIALENFSTFTISTVGATSVGDPGSICGQTVAQGAWYSFTPLSNGTVTVSTCGSDFDTVLQVYNGNCAALTPMVCNDDGCGFQSSATFTATGGTTYRIFAGGKNGANGALRMFASYVPSNDLCADAITLTEGVTHTASALGATSAGEAKTACNRVVGHGVWYRFTPSASGTINVNTCGSDYDTVLEIYTGSCASLTAVACNDDGCGVQSTTDFAATAGVNYLIFAGGFADFSGTLRIVAGGTGGGGTVTPPSNDLCASAAPLTNGVTVTVNTATATSTGDPTPTCGTDPGKGVWFTFVPTVNGNLTISTCGSDFDTVLQVYTGSCGALTEVNCNNDSCGAQAEAVFNATSGTLYRILAAGASQAGGTLRIVARESVPPPSGLPDYALEDVQSNKSVYLPGETGTVTVTVTNKGGSSSAQAFSVDLFRHQTSPAGCNSNYYRRVLRPTIPPGSTSVFDVPFTNFPSEGAFVLRVFVDGACSVAETNENNNQLTTGYSVQTGLPDLVIQSLSLNKATFATNEVGTAAVTIRNQGSGSTLVSSTAILYANAAGSVSCGTAGDSTKTIGVLAAGASVTTTIGFTASASGGTFTLRVFTDGNCVVPELNEANNQVTLSYAVIAVGPPDLVLQSLVLNKGAYAPGEIGTATVTIRNLGSSSTGVSYAVDLFRQSTSPASCGASYYRRANRPALAAGGTDTFTIPFTNLTLGGGYTMRVFADATCAVAESNEGNNQATQPYSVVTGPPDLTVQSLTLNKGTYTAGEIGTVTVTIHNQSTNSTGTGYVLDIYRHSPSAVGCAAPYYRRVSRPALAGGGNDTFTVPFTSFSVAGGYILRVYADSPCALAETDESNNQATVNYGVSAPAPTSLSNDGTPTDP
jgi:subtilase family serine protease